MRSMLEVTVKYTNSERDSFNASYTPSTQQLYEPRDEGTKIGRPFALPQFIPPPPTTERPQTPKVVVYECNDYRIENGVLVIEQATGSPDGYMIPLSVIQEIKVARAVPVSEELNAFEKLRKDA